MGRFPLAQHNKNKMSEPEAKELTQESLRRILHYDPETGHLTWLEKVAKKVVVGARAGWSQACKRKPYLRYRYVTLMGRRYAEHRLIWFWLHGEWPKHQIDHIDGNGELNKQSNLRTAEPYENSQNTARRLPPRSGYTGVYWHPKAGKWESKINFRGGTTYLGLFTNKEDARQAYLNAKEVIHTFNPKPRKTKTNGKSDQTATRG